MLRPLYIQFHTLLIIFAVVFPSLATAQDERNMTCGSDEPNSCPWDKAAWEEVWHLQHIACQQKIGDSETGTFAYGQSNNSWAAQFQVRLEPGYDNSNCWEATSAIISGCFDTSRGKYQRSGSWCDNEECTEWYWVWMNPDYKPGC